MIPTLMPGDEVLVDTRVYRGRSPQVGEIVVAQRPDRQEVVLIKRVAERLPDGRLIVRGDNPAASTDSVQFGPVAPNYLVGKATSRFA